MKRFTRDLREIRIMVYNLADWKISIQDGVIFAGPFTLKNFGTANIFMELDEDSLVVSWENVIFRLGGSPKEWHPHCESHSVEELFSAATRIIKSNTK